MPSKTIGLLVTSFIIGSAITSSPVFAQQTATSVTPAAAFLLWPNETNADPETAGHQNLFTAVHTAKSWLQRQVDNQLAAPSYRAPVVSSKNVPIEIIAALWQAETNAFDYTRLLKSGSQLSPITNPHYSFKLIRDNGVNSVIEVSNRPDLQVLGLIHPVFADISTAQRPRYRLDNVVYIPYSDQLNNDVIVRAGEEYLEKKIQAVYGELNTLGIHSWAQPDKLITEVINPAVVKSILAIEHVDISVLLNGSALSYLRKFYTTLALNEHASYAYAKSAAAARGLVQFIPSTYASLRRLRPELTLNADFVQGMTDPYNAIKAEIALLDYNLSLLPSAVRAKSEANPLDLGSYLAAMYNGGPARVRQAIAKWGSDWHSYHGNVASSLKLETAYYVAKFRLVYAHFNERPLYLATTTP